MTFIPTAEQLDAIRLFNTGKDMAIQAGAGTGKTSTLVQLAEEANLRGLRGQYIAFNKAIVSDAGAKMPGNVVCSTAHSLAFRAYGRRFAHRLNSPRMKSADIARMLRIDPYIIHYGQQSKPLAAGFLAGLVMRTIGRFCQTADEAPAAEHVPYIDGIDVPTADGRRTYDSNRAVRQHIMPAVLRAWADLSDTKGQLPYKHDHYLKQWQLSGPRIDTDFILFDEAQDANPVMVAIVMAQAKHAQLVFVGDSQQQIYAFTGAVNALDSIVEELDGETTYLTQSFRFGPAIADVANGLLERLDADLRLQGTPTIASVVAETADPDCILTRTNAVAVQTMLALLAENRRVALVGGGREVLDFARAARELQAGRFTAHPELACFQTWGEVQEYVEQDAQGGELRLLVHLIDEFGVDMIMRALDHGVTERDADVVISTAHKSKGREWGSVKLAGDFKAGKDGADVDAEELRLLYVACTRARRELDVSECPQAVEVPDGPAPLPAFLADDEPAAAPQAAEEAPVVAAETEPAAHGACAECGYPLPAGQRTCRNRPACERRAALNMTSRYNTPIG